MSRREVLLTNGLGGYSLFAVDGDLPRSYSGLLTAAMRPPVERRLFVASLDDLGAPDVFERDPFPRHVWTRPGGARIERRVVMVHGRNEVLVRYRLVEAERRLTLSLEPWLAFRDHHTVRRGDPRPEPPVTDAGAAAAPAFPVHRVFTTPGEPALHLHASAGRWIEAPGWRRDVPHENETERGLPDLDDFMVAGSLDAELESGSGVDVLLTMHAEMPEAPEVLEGREMDRLSLIVAHERNLPGPASPGSGKRKFAGRYGSVELAFAGLVAAADQFLVRRGADQLSIMAGYPWFTDWGRDTMISLPGLCFVTGRVEEGGRILETFASHLRDGLLPNHFPDAGDAPEYNTLDASLWFFQAVKSFLDHGGDPELAGRALFPACREILAGYRRGTHFGIGVDADGLVRWDQPGQALTWMDARVDDWAVTPRRGRPVEIQALWHGALHVMASLVRRFPADEKEARNLLDEAARLKEVFNRRFWNQENGALYDLIDPAGRPDPAIRPNMLYAVSLPYDLVPVERGRRIVDMARRHLLTPVGLRSLSPEDPAYIGTYRGNRRERDAAYHQGTVWGFLLGPYAEAVLRTAVDPAEARAEIAAILGGASRHLEVDAIGSYAEIFDGDPPHAPRGCPAQAWSVAEMLRLASLIFGDDA